MKKPNFVKVVSKMVVLDCGDGFEVAIETNFLSEERHAWIRHKYSDMMMYMFGLDAKICSSDDYFLEIVQRNLEVYKHCYAHDVMVGDICKN